MSKIEYVVKAGAGSSISKLRFVFVRDAIDGTIVQLEQWHCIFDPTSYLILRIGVKIIDVELAKPSDTTSSMTLLSFSTVTSAGNRTLSINSARKLRGSLAIQPHRGVPFILQRSLDWDGAVEIEHSNTRMTWRTGRRQRPFIVDTIVYTPEHECLRPGIAQELWWGSSLPSIHMLLGSCRASALSSGVTVLVEARIDQHDIPDASPPWRANQPAAPSPT